MSQQIPDPSELFPLLLSNDLHVIHEIKSLIQDSLNSARDPGFLNTLVDFYIRTNSYNALDLLAGIREPLDKPMMDRLNDNMKAGHKLQSLTLLSHVVRHQPSWLHKIVQAPLFTSLLTCLKMDTDIPVIMCGLLTVTTLLPMIPSLVGPFLQDIFGIFSRLASWTIKKPGGIPDVYQLHIQVAVYALFHRLYGMYPWNFLQYLRSYYRSKNAEFKTTVLPMLERVRMHPSLVIGSSQSETEKTRWRQMEVHDVLMECARVSLDTTESARDDSFSYTPGAAGYDFERRGSKGIGLSMLGQGIRTSSPIVDAQGAESTHKPLIHWESDTKKKDPDAQSLVSSQEGGLSMFSPSMVCGLSTPPHSHPPSPQGSQLDISLMSSTQLHCPTPHLDTPTPTSTPRDSPHPIVAMRSSSRMSSMSDGSVHSRGSKTKTPRGKLPPISTHSAMTLGRTVSAPVTPGYETKSLPSTPQKPLVSKAASHEITKQRRFVWGDTHLSDSLPSNGDFSSLKQPAEDEAVEEQRETRTERTESSVSLKDLPEVIKDLNHVEERPRDDYAINEEVSSFTGSPCTLRDFESSIASSSNLPLHAKPTNKTPEQNQDTLEMDATTISSSSEQPTIVGVQHKNGTERPETVRTQSDPSASHRNATIKALVESESRPRNSSFGNKPNSGISADLFGVGMSREASAEQSATYQGFMPISSYESQIFRQGAHSTVSETPSTPGAPFVQQAPLQMPYMHLFNLIVPTLQNLTPAVTKSRDHSPSVSSANSTMGGLYATPPPTSRAESALSSGTSADSIGTVPLHSLYSPSQLLDRHLQLGNQTHDNQLTGLPLTSQESVDWTHFGGSPPVDEIKLLKGQLQLLHNQLLYERHKREVHAERNRRLLGKTHKAKALEESNAAMQNQRQLLEDEVKRLKAEYKLLREENKQLAEANADKDEIHNALMKKLQRENEQMRDANEELQKLLVQHKHEVDNVTKELQATNAKGFTLRQELDNTRADIATNRHLKDEIARLNKELLLMGETIVKYRERVDDMQQNDNKMEEREMGWAALKKDLAASQDALKAKSVQLEAASARIAEMEAGLTQKEVAMSEQKRFLENVKSLTKGKIEAMDGKYNSLKKINQRLEAHILKLTKHLKETEKESHGRRRHQPSSGTVIPQSRSSAPSQMDVVYKGARSESLDSGRLFRSNVSTDLGKTSSRRVLERSQSHTDSHKEILKQVDFGSRDKESMVKTESDFSLKSQGASNESTQTVTNLSGTQSSPRASPTSDFENLSGEMTPESKPQKEREEAIRVPVVMERIRTEARDAPARLNINSPPLVFSDTSPFQRVQQSPRFGTRHSSLSPSNMNSSGRNTISSGPSSQSCPNLESGVKAAVSPHQFPGSFPEQVEEGEGVLQEGEKTDCGSSMPPGAVVDSVEPSTFHLGLVAMVHMEASVEEADLTKL